MIYAITVKELQLLQNIDLATYTGPDRKIIKSLQHAARYGSQPERMASIIPVRTGDGNNNSQ